VWILLDVWTTISAVLPKSCSAFKEWQSFCRELGLEAKFMTQKLDAMDALLDQIDEKVEEI